MVVRQVQAFTFPQKIYGIGRLDVEGKRFEHNGLALEYSFLLYLWVLLSEKVVEVFVHMLQHASLEVVSFTELKPIF